MWSAKSMPVATHCRRLCNTWPTRHYLSWFFPSSTSHRSSLLSQTYWARLSVEYLCLLFSPYWLFLCYISGCQFSVPVITTHNLLCVHLWSPTISSLSFRSSVFLWFPLFSFFGLKQETESPGRWFFNFMFDTLYIQFLDFPGAVVFTIFLKNNTFISEF